VLLTVDEERGLTGASGIEPGFFTAKRMINLDSESDHGFYIGCAGGRDTILRLECERAEAPSGWKATRISVTGLRGGHSGVDIHLNRGNAIKVLARALSEAREQTPFRLVSVGGGSKRNALPREAEAVVIVKGGNLATLQATVRNAAARIEKEELAGIEKDVLVSFKDEPSGIAFTDEETARILDLLLAVPHGVTAMSQAIPDLVESSTNLGVVTTQGPRVEIVCCSRSSVMSALDGLARQHRSLAMLAGAEAVHSDGYPGWKPNTESPLLGVAKECYRGLFQTEPKLEAIHAGLECGLLTEKYPDLDMVSMGPRIEDAHSPAERVSITSVQKSWELLKAVLEKLAGQ
jgi:dipeptidase D